MQGYRNREDRMYDTELRSLLKTGKIIIIH